MSGPYSVGLLAAGLAASSLAAAATTTRAAAEVVACNDEDGTLTGMVAHQGRGLADIVVTAEASAGLEAGYERAITDDTGAYTICIWQPGQYWVSFGHGAGEGSFNPREPVAWASELFNNKRTWQTPTLVTVSAGQVTGGVNAEMEKAASLEGTVFDKDGRPLAKAQVVKNNPDIDYRNRATDSSESDAIPDANGRWRLDGQQPGDYYVLVYANNQGYAGRDAVIWWKDAPGLLDLQPKAAIPIHVSAGQQVTGINTHFATTAGRQTVTPPKTVKRGDVVTLPNTTSDKSKVTWKSKTLKICKVTKKGSNASPKWRLNGLKKGTCKLRATASATPRAPALHQNVRIKVK